MRTLAKSVHTVSRNPTTFDRRWSTTPNISFAVIRGIPVVRENYEKEKIEISFNPITEKFEVADAATRRDHSFIPNISVLWDKSTDMFEMVDTYVQNNQEQTNLTPDDIKRSGNQ